MNIDWEKISEAFAELTKIMYEKMERFSEAFESIEDQVDEYLEWKKQNEHMRSTWFIPIDTRTKSQVIDNKPKFVVRKVIR